MKPLIYLLLSLILLTTNLEAKKCCNRKRHNKKTSKKETPLNCEDIKKELKKLQFAQTTVTIDGKNMKQLREQQLRILAKVALYDGVLEIVTTYQAAVKKFKNELDKSQQNIEKLAKDAQEVIDAEAQLLNIYDKLHPLKGRRRRVKKPTTGSVFQEIDDFLVNKCGKRKYFQVLQRDKLYFNFGENKFEEVKDPKQRRLCEQALGFEAQLKILNDHQTSDKILQELDAELAKVAKDNKEFSDYAKQLKKSLNRYKKKITSCYHRSRYRNFSAQRLKKHLHNRCEQRITKRFLQNLHQQRPKGTRRDSKISFSLRYQKELKKLKQELNKDIIEKKFKATQAEISRLNIQLQELANPDKVDDIDSSKLIKELCPNSSQEEATKILIACIDSLRPQELQKKLAAAKKESAAIEQKISKLREDKKYRAIEQAKQLIISKHRVDCFPRYKLEANCTKINVGDKSLQTMYQLEKDLRVTVDEGNVTSSNSYISGRKLDNLCRSSSTIKRLAAKSCKQQKRHRRTREFFRTHHVRYVDNGDGTLTEYAQQRDSTLGTVAFAGLKTGMSNIGQYLAIHNMKDQNEYLYQQAVYQKNLNYFNDQQFQWYMQNYTLYGPQYFSFLNGGYNPYYANTFQMGNSSFGNNPSLSAYYSF